LTRDTEGSDDILQGLFETVGNVRNLLRINISGRSDLPRDVLSLQTVVSSHFTEKNLTVKSRRPLLLIVMILTLIV
jgi:hypothetical protein